MDDTSKLGTAFYSKRHSAQRHSGWLMVLGRIERMDWYAEPFYRIPRLKDSSIMRGRRLKKRDRRALRGRSQVQGPEDVPGLRWEKEETLTIVVL